MAFVNAWTQIQNIPIGTLIDNWTACSGYIGNLAKVIHINHNHITFETVHAKNRQIAPKDAFEDAYYFWVRYINGQLARYKFARNHRYSGYIISTFKWLSVNNNGHIP